MKAITRDRFGSPDVLRFDEVDRPAPGPGQLLVRVHAAGVHRGDALELRGWPYVGRLMGYGLRRPKQPVLGTDLAGTVVALGPDVAGHDGDGHGFDVDDEIVGWGIGAFGELALVDATKAVRRPTSVDAITAAGLPTTGVTALQAVRAAGPMDGAHVLVIGASGGVGSFAVQLAVAAGASVSAVVGTPNVELARSLGATEVIDHRVTEVTSVHRHYDAIIDLAGVHPLGELRRMLTARGTLVVVGGQKPQSLFGVPRFAGAALRSPFTRRRLTPLFATQDTDALAQLVDAVADGVVRAPVGRTYDLSDTVAALHQIETGHTAGKLIITV